MRGDEAPFGDAGHDLWSVPHSPSPARAAGFGAYAGQVSVAANRIALAGAALTIVPILGTVLSILGLTRAHARGGAGRSVATVGLVLSVAFTGVEAAGAYELSRPGTIDPACAATRSDVQAMQTRLVADETALADGTGTGIGTGTGTGVGTGTGANAGMTAAESRLVADVSAMKMNVDRDLTRATHADVHAALVKVDTDLGTLVAALRRVEIGDEDALGLLESASGRLRADGQTVDDLCDAASAA